MEKIFLLLFIFTLQAARSQDIYIIPDQLSWSNFKGTPATKTDPHGKKGISMRLPGRKSLYLFPVVKSPDPQRRLMFFFVRILHL